MKTNVRWKGDVAFEGQVERGHSVMMDGPPEFGGKDQGFRPMELLLTGVGGCAAFDVVHILQKFRADIRDVVCEVSSERSEEPPKVFTGVHLHFVVTGKDLKEAHVKRAVRMTAETYCSGSIMMARAGAEVTHDYEIVEVSD